MYFQIAAAIFTIILIDSLGWQHTASVATEVLYQLRLHPKLLFPKERALRAVQKDGEQLKNYPKYLSDKDVVTAAVEENSFALFYASDEMKADREILLSAIAKVVLEERKTPPLYYAAPNLRANMDVVLTSVLMDGRALEYAAPNLQANIEIVLTALKNHGCALEYAAESLRADKYVVLKALATDGCALEYAAESLRADKEVVLRALATAGRRALEYAAESLKNDNQIVTAVEDFEKNKVKIWQTQALDRDSKEYKDLLPTGQPTQNIGPFNG